MGHEGAVEANHEVLKRILLVEEHSLAGIVAY